VTGMMIVAMRRRMFMVMVMLMRVFMLMTSLLLPKFLPGQFFFAGRDYINLCGADAAAIYARDFQVGIHAKSHDRPPEQFRRNSGVDQRAKKHVATDPGKAFEVSNSHAALKSIIGMPVQAVKPAEINCFAIIAFLPAAYGDSSSHCLSSE